MEEKKLIKAMSRVGDQFLSGNCPNIYGRVNMRYADRDMRLSPSYQSQMESRRGSLKDIFRNRVAFLKSVLIKDCLMLFAESKTRDGIIVDHEMRERFINDINIPYDYFDLEYLMEHHGGINLIDESLSVATAIYNSFIRNIVGVDMQNIDHDDIKNKMDIITNYCMYILTLIVYECITVYTGAGLTYHPEIDEKDKALEHNSKMYEGLLKCLHRQLFMKEMGEESNVVEQTPIELDIENIPNHKPNTMYRVYDNGSELSIKPADKVSKKEDKKFSSKLYTSGEIENEYGPRFREVLGDFNIGFGRLFNKMDSIGIF